MVLDDPHVSFKPEMKQTPQMLIKTSFYEHPFQNKCISKLHFTKIIPFFSVILSYVGCFLQLYACSFSCNIKTCNTLVSIDTHVKHHITPNPLPHFYIPIRCFLNVIGGSIYYAFVITTSVCKLFTKIYKKENTSQIRYKEDVDQIVHYFRNKYDTKRT